MRRKGYTELKKGRSRRVIQILCLALALAIAFPAQSVFAASGLTELRSEIVDLNDQLTLVKRVNYNGSNAENAVEHYFEYTPGGNILPLVSYGAGVYGVSSAKTVFSQEGEKDNVLAGLANGDFFVMATGVPLGPVIRDGIVRSSGYGESVIAFGEDGSAYIGDPSLNISLTFADRGETYQKVNFNKSLSKTNGICLYTADFGANNYASVAAYNVWLRIEEGEPRLGSSLECVVESGFESEGRTMLQEGYVLLSIAKDTSYAYTLQQLQSLQPEERVTVGFASAPEYENVQHALGFERWLVKDGLTVTGLDAATRAPRTAAGIKSDGTFLLYTVDGRQKGYSMGLTLAELANRMQELGCVQAVNLDGGASTQLFTVYPGFEKEIQVNRDSDASSLRSCSNYICFANLNEKDGIPARLHVYPFDEYVLSGTSVSMYVKATDKGYFSCEVPEGVTYSCDALGTVEDNVYTAGPKAGTGIIYAESGKISGSMRIYIIADPDRIATSVDGKETSTLTAGLDKSYELSAKAFYKGDVLRSDAACYTWAVEGDIGTIDENGVYAASGVHGAKGTITCSAGNTKKTIAVTLQQTLPAEQLQEWIREFVNEVQGE